MCDYTQVHYKCSHLRYTVRAWCTKYQETHKRCPPNVIAMYGRALFPRLHNKALTAPAENTASTKIVVGPDYCVPFPQHHLTCI
ncbi:hypothetical protein P154DRAFT_524179 [Amniculicola lignicola CBS 123094]|uniref:Uncharacterized protein n=1 Tax=Amniculicola lignicola CBS 123094 TaxID=1392246 RepID=A0A6A5W8K9_9PLEO|nr:hypothetical protein P154DRAFT_524179 [Amniculicola lignicola CBS 123094]